MKHIKENKAEIISRLGETYALTNEDIESMEYLHDIIDDTELIIVYGKDGKILLEINGYWSCGCNMIMDAVKAVKKMYLGE